MQVAEVVGELGEVREKAEEAAAVHMDVRLERGGDRRRSRTRKRSGEHNRVPLMHRERFGDTKMGGRIEECRVGGNTSSGRRRLMRGSGTAHALVTRTDQAVRYPH